MTAAAYTRARNKLIPGARVYTCAFAVAKNGAKVVKCLLPCVSELCCSCLPSSEQMLRGMNKCAAWAVPVLSDGTLDWPNARDLWHVNIADTEAEIKLDFNHDLNEAKLQLSRCFAKLEATETRVREVTNDFLTLTAAPLPPL